MHDREAEIYCSSKCEQNGHQWPVSVIHHTTKLASRSNAAFPLARLTTGIPQRSAGTMACPVPPVIGALVISDSHLSEVQHTTKSTGDRKSAPNT